MHAEGNITCRSTVEKLHIWGSPAWILENLMFCKCIGGGREFYDGPEGSHMQIKNVAAN